MVILFCAIDTVYTGNVVLLLFLNNKYFRFLIKRLTYKLILIGGKVDAAVSKTVLKKDVGSNPILDT